MVKKVEAFKAWDDTVHPTHDAALKHEFTKALEDIFLRNSEVNLTEPQIHILWRQRDKLAQYFMPNILEAK